MPSARAAAIAVVVALVTGCGFVGGDDGATREAMRNDPVYLFEPPSDLVVDVERSSSCDSDGDEYALTSTITVEPDHAAEVADLVQEELWAEGWRVRGDSSRDAAFRDRTNRAYVNEQEDRYRIVHSAEPFEVIVSVRSDARC